MINVVSQIHSVILALILSDLRHNTHTKRYTQIEHVVNLVKWQKANSTWNKFYNFEVMSSVQNFKTIVNSLVLDIS